MKALLCLFSGLVSAYLTAFNDERLLVNSKPVIVNNEVVNYLKKIDEDYFFKISNNSYTVKEYGRVQNLSCQFFKPLNFTYLFRDTIKTDIASIINFRSRQRQCFNKYKCNSVFNDFVSCLRDPREISVIGDGKKCSWAMYYYPRIVHKDLLQIACIELGIRGPAVPSHLYNVQLKSFVCYGLFKERAFNSSRGNFVSDKFLNDNF